MNPDPSLDPNRTAAHLPADGLPSETLDLTHAQTTPPASTTQPPTDAPVIPGYQITAWLAKGGMGRVFAGHDAILDREVAIKTLLPGANADRFVTEAKITAKLPHPGIPPVYALGTLHDGTPWLAMKLIRGQTLANLLANRLRQRPELPRFIQIFEQVAQAVGFAHAQGIIHRDLKPLNVMVGEFGEVQVMDWGLAKDTTRVTPASPGRQSREPASPAPQSGEPASPGRQSEESFENVHHTAAGTVMGTPGYMAPEQARGEVVDVRADVFALGSILAAILTGQPAFVGTTARETIDQAAKADTADVLARLNACGADADVVTLCKRCLAAKPADRPANGQVVAADVAAYRAGVEARLRQAETDRARAETRAAEQTKRRRVQLALAVTLLAAITGGGAVAWWQERQATARRIETANREREEANRLARTGTAVASLLQQCEDALHVEDTDKARLSLDAARGQSAEGGADHLHDRLQRCTADLAILSELNAVDQYRWTIDPVTGRRPNPKQVALKLRPVIHHFGIVPGVTPPDEAARLVAGSSVQARIIAALDLLMYTTYPEQTAELRAILQAADSHPYRNALREAAFARGATLTVADFAQLAADDQAAEQPPGFIALYLEIAPLMGAIDPALGRRRELLMRALRRSPGNLPLIMTLSGMYPIEPRRGPAPPLPPLWLTTVPQAVPQAAGDGVEAMVRWYQAGVAVHPRNLAVRLNLGAALLNKRDLSEAIAEFREAVRLDPQVSIAHNNLGIALGQTKDTPGAIAAFREAIRLDPNDDAPHNNLGIVLQATGQLDAAIAEFREAIRLNSQSYHAHSSLGSALGMRGNIEEAIPLIQRAIQLERNHPRDFVSLAVCLQKKGDLGGAIAAFDEAIRLDPAMPKPIRDHVNKLKQFKALEDTQLRDRLAPLPREVKR